MNSINTFTVPIGFRLCAIAQLTLSKSEKYSAKWDRGFTTCTHAVYKHF